jgi:shikimate kinase
MMGTGKSAVGKKLAKKLGMEYMDTDERIEKDAGCKISEIFKNNGEESFREVEKAVIKCVSVLDNYVIATGGGVVKYAENMDALEKNAVIVCLTASPDAIYKRIKHHGHRPLLKVKDPRKEIEGIMNQREKLYKRCDLMIDTSDKKIDEIVGEIIKFIIDIREEE